MDHETGTEEHRRYCTSSSETDDSDGCSDAIEAMQQWIEDSGGGIQTKRTLGIEYHDEPTRTSHKEITQMYNTKGDSDCEQTNGDSLCMLKVKTINEKMIVSSEVNSDRDTLEDCEVIHMQDNHAARTYTKATEKDSTMDRQQTCVFMDSDKSVNVSERNFRTKQARRKTEKNRTSKSDNRGKDLPNSLSKAQPNASNSNIATDLSERHTGENVSKQSERASSKNARSLIKIYSFDSNSTSLPAKNVERDTTKCTRRNKAWSEGPRGKRDVLEDSTDRTENHQGSKAGTRESPQKRDILEDSTDGTMAKQLANRSSKSAVMKNVECKTKESGHSNKARSKGASRKVDTSQGNSLNTKQLVDGSVTTKQTVSKTSDKTSPRNKRSRDSSQDSSVITKQSSKSRPTSNHKSSTSGKRRKDAPGKEVTSKHGTVTGTSKTAKKSSHQGISKDVDGPCTKVVTSRTRAGELIISPIEPKERDLEKISGKRSEKVKKLRNRVQELKKEVEIVSKSLRSKKEMDAGQTLKGTNEREKRDHRQSPHDKSSKKDVPKKNQNTLKHSKTTSKQSPKYQSQRSENTKQASQQSPDRSKSPVMSLNDAFLEVRKSSSTTSKRDPNHPRQDNVPLKQTSTQSPDNRESPVRSLNHAFIEVSMLGQAGSCDEKHSHDKHSHLVESSSNQPAHKQDQVSGKDTRSKRKAKEEKTGSKSRGKQCRVARKDLTELEKLEKLQEPGLKVTSWLDKSDKWIPDDTSSNQLANKQALRKGDQNTQEEQVGQSISSVNSFYGKRVNTDRLHSQKSHSQPLTCEIEQFSQTPSNLHITSPWKVRNQLLKRVHTFQNCIDDVLIGSPPINNKSFSVEGKWSHDLGQAVLKNQSAEMSASSKHDQKTEITPCDSKTDSRGREVSKPAKIEDQTNSKPKRKFIGKLLDKIAEHEYHDTKNTQTSMPSKKMTGEMLERIAKFEKQIDVAMKQKSDQLEGYKNRSLTSEGINDALEKKSQTSRKNKQSKTEEVRRVKRALSFGSQSSSERGASTSLEKSKKQNLPGKQKNERHPQLKTLYINTSAPTEGPSSTKPHDSDSIRQPRSSCRSSDQGTRKSRRLQYKCFAEDDGDSSDCVVVEVCHSPEVKQTTHVRPHMLSKNDRNILMCANQWLNDIHINLAHSLLKKQFPQTAGLENCGLAKFSTCAGKPFVQLLNTRGVHWLCVTNLLCKGDISAHAYDSSFRTLHTDTKTALKEILGTGKQTINALMPPYQRQPTSQCGVFAIATATALLFGKDPSAITFDVTKMRRHLANCFDKQEMRPFPELDKQLKKLNKRTFSF